MDAKSYKRYKQRIAQVVAKIDNKPPKFDTAIYFKVRSLMMELNRVRKLDRENMKLLKRMNLITRLGGNTDCWLPKITYASSLEDPTIKNKIIKKTNHQLLKNIRKASSQYSTAEFIRHWREMRIAAQYLRRYQIDPATHVIGLQSHQDHCMIKDLSLLKEMNPSIRTKCFFEIEIREDKQKLGYIQFELYDDVVPQTCANFTELCRGYNGLSYKNTPLHRIVSGYWCQGGDVTKFNGSGGTSIYGESFENENYNLRHAGPGILSMCSEDEKVCNSKFNLTFRQLETVNGKHVVFGKVIKGLSNIYKVEEFGTKTGKPYKTIIVSNCGVVTKNVNGTYKEKSKV